MNDEAHNRTGGRVTRVAAAGALMLSLTAIPVVANAQTPDSQPTPTTAPAADATTTEAVETSPAPEGEDGSIDCDVIFGDFDADFDVDVDFGVELDELSDEEREQILAEEQQVADALDAAGVDYEWIDAEGGLRWVEIDWDDDAAVAALEDHWNESFDIEDIEGELIDFELTPEDIAEINAEVDEMVAALEAAGVAVNVTTTDEGFKDFEIIDDSEETDALVDAVFEELWGDEGVVEVLEGDLDDMMVFDVEMGEMGEAVFAADFDGDFEECFDEFDFELTPEDIAEINADSEELIEALEAAGVPVSSTTDEDGVIEFEIDSEDLSVLDAADEVFDDFYGCDDADFDIEDGGVVEAEAGEVANQ